MLDSSVANLSGGLRVVFEHVNYLLRLGHNVEIWQTNTTDIDPCLPTRAIIKVFNAEELHIPDIIVMTDITFLPIVVERRSKRGNFLLLQHDSEWLAAQAHASPALLSIFRYFNALIEQSKTQIIVVSQWLKEVVNERYNLTATLIRNGLDHTVFRPKTPILRANSPILLLAYDAQPWKGFNLALEAAKLAKIKFPELTIAILAKHVLNPGITYPAGTIIFYRPDQSKLARLYASATVFLSTSAKEGFGLQGLEALACGTPIITTDAGGVREYADETTAIIVKPDTAYIAEKVVLLLQSPRLLQTLRTNGIKRAAEFTWEKSLEALGKLILQS